MRKTGPVLAALAAVIGSVAWMARRRTPGRHASSPSKVRSTATQAPDDGFSVPAPVPANAVYSPEGADPFR